MVGVCGVQEERFRTAKAQLDDGSPPLARVPANVSNDERRVMATAPELKGDWLGVVSAYALALSSGGHSLQLGFRRCVAGERTHVFL